MDKIIDNFFDVPILLIVFNRPESTQRVFDSIRFCKPRNLYVSMDGPRNLDEAELCKKTKEIVQNIDWECNVTYRINETNLGCAKGVSSAITWFFSFVSYGIILEDDCLPTQDFFLFCNHMLQEYDSNHQIMQINGYNEFGSDLKSGVYYQTVYPRIWGWATWKRSWDKYDFSFELWDNTKNKWILLLKRYGLMEGIIRFIKWRSFYTLAIKNKKFDTWDYQWNLTLMREKGKCIQPEANLILNIGLDNGTHYTSSDISTKNKLSYGELEYSFEKKSSLIFDIRTSFSYTFDKFKKITNKFF